VRAGDIVRLCSKKFVFDVDDSTRTETMVPETLRGASTNWR
jgi:hypothetical protein